MAGGVYGVSNTLYYLHSGFSYWTISPGFLMDYGYAVACNSIVYSNGEIGKLEVSTNGGVRPVINIKGNVPFTGTGTKEDPYQLSGQ